MTKQRTTAVEQTSVPVEWQAPVSFLVSFYKALKAKHTKGKAGACMEKSSFPFSTFSDDAMRRILLAKSASWELACLNDSRNI